MKLHTIAGVKPLADGRLSLAFDEGDTVDIDLSPMISQGGVFAPLRDPARFATVEIGPDDRTLVWRIGGDTVDLCADALWLMTHPGSAG
jgi:Protein of unknown function (DUF2442)